MNNTSDVQGEITLSETSKSRSARDPPERRDPRELVANGSPTLTGNLLSSEQRDVLENFVSGDEFVCSYDKDPSHLYTLLESSNWNMASIRCRTHPNEVRTWVVRRDAETRVMRWALLPIHSAVIFKSPSSLVEEILQAYPCGISRRDDQGMMPLHLAFRHKNTDENLLITLLKQYPSAITSPDIRGRTPLDLGRGGTYSANLIKAYADCCVTLSTQSQEQDTAKSIFIATKEYETSLIAVKSDYATQIQRLNDHFEKRIHMLESTHRAEIQKLKENANLEKAKLMKLHHEDIKCLHEVVASTQDNEKCNQREELRCEVEKLQAEVKTLVVNNERLQASLNIKQATFSEAEMQISAIMSEQEVLKSLIVQQQQELEAAKEMRLQLLKTLLQQENDDTPNFSKNFKSIGDAIHTSSLQIEKLSKCFLNSDERNHDIMQYESFAQIEPQAGDDISAITEHSNL